MEIQKHNKTALLLGANELVGRKCLLQLLYHEAYSKIILLLEEPFELSHSKLEVHQISFESLDKHAALLQTDDVYYCWGGQMRLKYDPSQYNARGTYAFQVAQLCVENGARQFVFLSSIGADTNNVLSYRQEKKELELAISSLPYWATHIFRPGILVEDDKGSRSVRFLKNISNRLNNLAGGGLSKYKPLSAKDLAKAMIQKAQHFQEGVHIYSSEYLQEFFKQQEQGLSKRNG